LSAPNDNVVPGLVSVIIPVFNRSAMLREAVQSALEQSYRPIEVIIVDDESTDETVETIAELERAHAEVKAIRQPNGGPGVARERGRLLAKGEYIQYLDSDDLILPLKIERQVAALRSAPACGVAYGRTRYVDRSGLEIQCSWKNSDRVVETMLPSFLEERWWETATPLYRASVCEAAGPWLPTRLEEDWEYDCRIGALGTRLVRVNDYVAVHRDHDSQRLSRGSELNPARLADRAVAHFAIVQHAMHAAIPPQTPEMKRLVRDVFHIARQCGAAGLTLESRQLIRAARGISRAWDIACYQRLANAIGWQTLPSLLRLVGRL
jgi:glycosyltransferase involved in cell wall biosynthesis